MLAGIDAQIDSRGRPCDVRIVSMYNDRRWRGDEARKGAYSKERIDIER